MTDAISKLAALYDSALENLDAEQRVALFSGNPIKTWFDEKGMHFKIIYPDDFYYTPPK